jgi:hypothetical protein
LKKKSKKNREILEDSSSIKEILEDLSSIEDLYRFYEVPIEWFLEEFYQEIAFIENFILCHSLSFFFMRSIQTFYLKVSCIS